MGRNGESTGAVSKGAISGETVSGAAVSGAAVEEEKERNRNPKWNEIQQMVADVYPYHSSRCVYSMIWIMSILTTGSFTASVKKSGAMMWSRRKSCYC